MDSVFEIHELPVLAWAQTELALVGVVLVQTRFGNRPEWVTARYRIGEKEWSNGNYFFDKKAAFKDFYERACLTGAWSEF